MSNDAVAYSYTNVGFIQDPPVNTGVAYSYANIGAFATVAWLGKVVGYAGSLLIGYSYTYANILEYIHVPGDPMITEDGDPMVTEGDDPMITED